MTDEEYFRKHYPDSCYGDKPLSPYWDFFQDGVEFGERQSENQIADIKANCDLAIEGRDVKIKELEQQIEKMKCCRNCRHPKTPVDNTCCDCENYSKWELRR